ncbi:hypothetical protein D3C87_2035090 [compost metagenome]
MLVEPGIGFAVVAYKHVLTFLAKSPDLFNQVFTKLIEIGKYRYTVNAAFFQLSDGKEVIKNLGKVANR